MLADVAVVDHITGVVTAELSELGNWHSTAPIWSTESTPESGTTFVATGLPVKLIVMINIAS